MSPLEEKLSQLLAGYGAGIYAEKFRCSSLIRDVYGIQKKEANILIAALNAGVPEALLGYYPSNRRATTIYKTRVTNRLNRPRHEGDRIETLYTR